MIEAVGQLNTRLTQERGCSSPCAWGPHRARGGGGSGRRHAPGTVGAGRDNLASPPARARRSTLVISAATWQLLRGFFACQSLGTFPQGFAQPLEVYQVLAESTARSRLDVAGSTGLTPLVGREQEVGLLLGALRR